MANWPEVKRSAGARVQRKEKSDPVQWWTWVTFSSV